MWVEPARGRLYLVRSADHGSALPCNQGPVCRDAPQYYMKFHVGKI